MSFYAFSLLLTSLVSLLLGSFVYQQKKRKLTHITLALLSASIALWCFGQFMGEVVESKNAVLFWTRVNIAGAIFIPVFYLHFILTYLRKMTEGKWILRGAYWGGLILLLFNFTPYFVADVAPRLSFRYYPLPGPIYFPFALFLFGLASYGMFLLFKELKRAFGQKKNQITYVFFASLAGFAGGITAFFPVFNIHLPTLSHFALPLYLFITIYAILKHQLLEIKLMVRSGLTYSILMIFFGTIYVSSIFLFQKLFQTFTGFNSLFASGLVLFAFVALFEPLRVKVEKSINQLLFKELANFSRVIRNLNQEITTGINLDELSAQVTQTLIQQLKISSAAIWLKDKDPLEFFAERKAIILEELESEIEENPFAVPELWKRKEKMQAMGTCLSLPLRGKENLVGVLHLGGKLSGETYSQEEVEMLKTLGNQLAVALENAHLYQELRQIDKVKTAAVISSGMAHEIKNPLAAIKGLTQVLPENLEDAEFMRKFMEIVPRQLDRIDNLIEDLLKFGKPSTPVFQAVALNPLLERLVKLIENQCTQQKILLNFQKEEIPPLKGDPEQLTQAFFNIILNALQAMPQRGKLELKTQKAKIKNDDYALVAISDTGEGIPADKLNNIFDPFFTTKEKGSGLGLSIACRIIQEHQGTIEVQSEVGKGTTFKVWFPIKQRPSV